MKAMIAALALGLAASPALADQYITLGTTPPADYLTTAPSDYELPVLHYHCWGELDQSKLEVEVDLNAMRIFAGDKVYKITQYGAQIFKSDPRAENEPLMIFSGAYTGSSTQVWASSARENGGFVDETGGHECRFVEAYYASVGKD
jgi:hypothetical protein